MKEQDYLTECFRKGVLNEPSKDKLIKYLLRDIVDLQPEIDEALKTGAEKRKVKKLIKQTEDKLKSNEEHLDRMCGNTQSSKKD